MKHLLYAFCIISFISCKQTEKSTENDSSEANSEMNITKSNPEVSSVLDSIAMAHGLEHWEKLNQINYTFNVDRGETHFERSWEWQPQQNKVKMTTADTTMAYQQTQLTEDLEAADQAFINDKYWLLFPFNLVWDSGLSHKDLGQTESPISKEQLRTIEINYNSEDGYTPGDTYTIYVDSDYILREWSYTPSGSEEPRLSTTWEDYVNMNGIKIAKTHKNAEGNFKLYFSGLTLN